MSIRIKIMLLVSVKQTTPQIRMELVFSYCWKLIRFSDGSH